VVDIPAEESEAHGPGERPSPPPTGKRMSGPARLSGIHDPLRLSPAPGAVTIPPEAGVFDLLEEHSPPPRRSGAHGQPASKVLLVDDEDSLRKVMRDLLERDGYLVTEARDGVQALDQVDRVGPDIIVLDLNLPGLDGYGVLSHLRSRPATANIPVIVLTAKGDEDNEVRVFELGADDFLTKPFRARALSARLEAVLGRRR
jgi:CheY-like chemotaxis protein